MTSYNVTGLQPGQTYSFQLRPVNVTGTGTATFNQLTADNVAATVPARPKSFNAYNGVQKGSVRLEWGDPNPPDPSITGWQTRSWSRDHSADGLVRNQDFVVGSGAIGQEITLEWSASNTDNVKEWGYQIEGDTTAYLICKQSEGPACRSKTSYTIVTETALDKDKRYTYKIVAVLEQQSGDAPTITNERTWATASGGGGARQAVIAGLEEYAEYGFKLRAANSAGAGPETGTAFIKTRGLVASIQALGNLQETESINYAVSLRAVLPKGEKPTGDVVVTIESVGDKDISVSPTRLTFKPENWNVPQTVTLTAAAEPQYKNEETFFTHTSFSHDPGFHGLTAVVRANARPEADAGGDQLSVSPGQRVTLYGEATYPIADADADGLELAYEWTQTRGSGVAWRSGRKGALKKENLDDNDTAVLRPTFTAPNVSSAPPISSSSSGWRRKR